MPVGGASSPPFPGGSGIMPAGTRTGVRGASLRLGQAKAGNARRSPPGSMAWSWHGCQFHDRLDCRGHGGRRTMDALTASLIVVGIGGAAFIMAAWITARSRIGVLPAKAVQDPSTPSHPWAGLPESDKQFRVFGWVLVVLLYLAAVFCLLQGLNALRIVHHWAQWEATFGSILTDRAEIALYSKFWIATAVALCFIGYWTQTRLRRRS